MGFSLKIDLEREGERNVQEEMSTKRTLGRKLEKREKQRNPSMALDQRGMSMVGLKVPRPFLRDEKRNFK